MKVTYLFTTFPLLSETPNQRELRALSKLPVDLEICSMYRGGGVFEGYRIQRFSLWRLLSLVWNLPYWLIRKPGVFGRLALRLFSNRWPEPINAGETLLGLAFAICHASEFARTDRRPDLFHAAWATAPATAAQLLNDLIGVPYSMAAHAYDVFRHGGDWDLDAKLKSAALIVTSCDSTRQRLAELGADSGKVALVRMGLDVLPAMHARRGERERLRLLAVGRLVDKKGYFDQLSVYAALRAADFPFEARIVGEGHLRRDLESKIAELALSEQVTLLGSLTPEAVFEQYYWADVLVFTGKVAESGDRDGLPNVVPEAMACGLPVVATAVAGVPEAVVNEVSGLLVRDKGTLPWLNALRRLQNEDKLYDSLRSGGRAWVETNYCADQNVGALLQYFRQASEKASTLRPEAQREHGLA